MKHIILFKRENGRKRNTENNVSDSYFKTRKRVIKEATMKTKNK